MTPSGSKSLMTSKEERVVVVRSTGRPG
uniref:3-deoxy-d-manno-octulosonic-acid transferase, putative n=1 Tax=Arundo donax TaxID=35708 RepID=A0A0A9FJ84_ARUDO